MKLRQFLAQFQWVKCALYRERISRERLGHKRLGHKRLSHKRLRRIDFSTLTNATRGGLFSLAIAVAIVVAADWHEARAEEAGTAPTCTGCSDSKTSSSREARTHHQEPKAPRHRNVSSARNPGGGLAGFDGAWAGLSTGHCIPNYNWTIQVGNGVISGGASGSVSRGGHVRASMMVNGYRYDVVGQARGSNASGTWSTTGDCSGRWTATKS
jgi:hypothetical protein